MYFHFFLPAKGLLSLPPQLKDPVDFYVHGKLRQSTCKCSKRRRVTNLSFLDLSWALGVGYVCIVPLFVKLIVALPVVSVP